MHERAIVRLRGKSWTDSTCSETHMRLSASLIAAVLVLTAADPLASQEPAALQADARVRLMMVGADRWSVGNLLKQTRDSVRLLAGDSGDTLAVATTSLARFEISKGRHRQTGRGALIGVAVGTVVGAVLGVATYEERGDRGSLVLDPGPGGSALLGGGLLGLLGAGIGALTGSQITAERWTPLPQPWGGGAQTAASSP
jgi:hypothetical protein